MSQDESKPFSDRSDQSSDSTSQTLQPPKVVILYTVIISIITVILFFVLLSISPVSPLSSGTTQTGDDSVQLFLVTIAVMLVAGSIGGCLYCFRGLIKHSRENNYNTHFNLTYFLRPLSGGICGVVVFFLLSGGVLILSTQPGTQTTPSWSTGPGQLPYIAIAFLAGFGSHEFMLKLKDIVKSIFSLSEPQKKRGAMVGKET